MQPRVQLQARYTVQYVAAWSVMHDARDTCVAAGPELTRAVEERETRIKMYALRMRAAAIRIAGGKQVGGCTPTALSIDGALPFVCGTALCSAVM